MKKPELKIQKFPTYATKPNILIENKTNTSKEKKEQKNSIWDEVPVYPEGWVVGEGNPENIVMGFSHLTLIRGYKLRAYIFISDLGSNGIVYAIPTDHELPPPEECITKNPHYLDAPVPANALKDLMKAITGDKTPMSYLQAAIVRHELYEYGASWHGTNWGNHRILPLDKKDMLEYTSRDEPGNWKMFEPKPDVWEPHFYYSKENEPVIVFYTISNIGQEKINRFVHTFSPEDYTLKIEICCIATGGGGIIF